MICWLPVLVLVFWHMQIVSNYVRQLQLQDNSRIHRVRLPAMLLCLNTQVMDQSASYEELLAAAATLGVCDSRQYTEWTLCPSCHPQVSEDGQRRGSSAAHFSELKRCLHSSFSCFQSEFGQSESVWFEVCPWWMVIDPSCHLACVSSMHIGWSYVETQLWCGQ